jgi:hypothetical protein
MTIEGPMPSSALTLAPRSIDMVRLIRRSIRCLIFGAIGFVPVLGLGMAEQALRLLRVILAEVGGHWRAPGIYWLWVLGVAAVWGTDRLLGLLADAIVLFAFLLLQVWWLWRAFPREAEAVWNPGHPQVFWGVILAYGGILNSLTVLTVLGQRLSQL